MSEGAHSRPAGEFDPHHLLKSADFFKWEGEDVSDDLRTLEGEILACLSGDNGGFEASIPPTLLAEVGAEIFDTLVSDYLRWYRCRVIAVRMPTEQDHLAFAGYVEIEKPLRMGLGIAYEMADAGWEPEGPAGRLHKIGLVPGSQRVIIDAHWSMRAVIAAMNIEAAVSRMLADPAGIIRRTLECRLRTAYEYREPLGDIGLAIDEGLVRVAIYSADHTAA